MNFYTIAALPYQCIGVDVRTSLDSGKLLTPWDTLKLNKFKNTIILIITPALNSQLSTLN